MKKIKFLNILFVASAFVLSSCVDDGTIEDEIKATPNLLGFASGSAAVSAVSDGEEYVKPLNVRMVGPKLDQVSGPVTATVTVDPSSTAVEGVHYRLETNTFTVGPDDNYLGTFSFVMLTDGILAPLAENPKLVLNVQSVSGDGSVIANGRPISVDMLYLCFADLTGNYAVTNDWCAPSFTAEISANADGSWALFSADGGWLSTCTGNAGLWNAGNINVVCGVVQPTNDLVYGGLGIGTILGGTWDAETGILTMQHIETYFNGGPREWESTYVRQ